jgi:hypothetical protein
MQLTRIAALTMQCSGHILIVHVHYVCTRYMPGGHIGGRVHNRLRPISVFDGHACFIIFSLPRQSVINRLLCVCVSCLHPTSRTLTRVRQSPRSDICARTQCSDTFQTRSHHSPYASKHTRTLFPCVIDKCAVGDYGSRHTVEP